MAGGRRRTPGTRKKEAAVLERKGFALYRETSDLVTVGSPTSETLHIAKMFFVRCFRSAAPATGSTKRRKRRSAAVKS